MEVLDIRSYGWHVPPTCPLPTWLNLSWTAYLGSHVDRPRGKSLAKRLGPQASQAVEGTGAEMKSVTTVREGDGTWDDVQSDYHVRTPPELDAGSLAEVYGELREVP